MPSSDSFRLLCSWLYWLIKLTAIGIANEINLTETEWKLTEEWRKIEVQLEKKWNELRIEWVMKSEMNAIPLRERMIVVERISEWIWAVIEEVEWKIGEIKKLIEPGNKKTLILIHESIINNQFWNWNQPSNSNWNQINFRIDWLKFSLNCGWFQKLVGLIHSAEVN